MSPAYKLTLLLTRRSELSQSAFVDAWLTRERRRPIVATGLVRHVFHAPVPGQRPIVGADAAPYDAVVETWWKRTNDAADWVTSHEFEQQWLVDRGELLGERPAAVGGRPNLIWERELTDAMTPVTVIVLPVARGSLRFSEFEDHWTGAHAQLALAGPGAKSRLVSIEDTPAPVPPPACFTSTRYDGVGAITFASPEALAAEFDNAWYREQLAPDERRFTNPDASSALVCTPIDLT
nr:EthD domain-containing protein [Microbacterium bovistercoris]